MRETCNSSSRYLTAFHLERQKQRFSGNIRGNQIPFSLITDLGHILVWSWKTWQPSGALPGGICEVDHNDELSVHGMHTPNKMVRCPPIRFIDEVSTRVGWRVVLVCQGCLECYNWNFWNRMTTRGIIFPSIWYSTHGCDLFHWNDNSEWDNMSSL